MFRTLKDIKAGQNHSYSRAQNLKKDFSYQNKKIFFFFKSTDVLLNKVEAFRLQPL